MTKKVFVSGCFDILHSGHIAFFDEASAYGDLYVALGSDKTVFKLKGRLPVNNEDERLFMVRSARSVEDAFVSQGSGMLDFMEEFITMKPDIMVVNADGHMPEKQELCVEHGVEYVVLQRVPHEGLPPRSTTALRTINQMPFRIDLAGGWQDQPFVSKYYPGGVITISLEPTIQFNERSGMASSTRRAAIEMWGPRIPTEDYEKLSKILFCYDNPPGTKIISGSQDSIGIVYPGLAKAHYEGDYWPTSIEHTLDETLLQFIEKNIYLVMLGPREDGYDVLDGTNINEENAKALALSTDQCWDAIHAQDVKAFGASIRATFEAQVAMFPNMLTPAAQKLIDQYRDKAYGWKLSGAGGGGYLVLISDRPIENASQIYIRREID
ncbi:MAG: adenylyltransferase/cytidyltransferase family protein [Chloroflexi bacterium]|nr:adenylyltransferase/cytidyltransferase family protein [Chloroflexota bacterium]